MAFDISDLHSKSMAAMYRAKRGDLRPLAELLRSKEEIDPRLRDYLADEIEKPAGSRFRREVGRSDIDRPKNDRRVLGQIYVAKFHIAAARLGLSDGDSDEVWADADVLDHLEKVTDADALRYLSNELGIDIDASYLNNVRTRSPHALFNVRKTRRRKP